MVLQKSKLMEVLQVSSTVGLIYANPNMTRTFVKSIVVFNSHIDNVILKIYNVPDSTNSVGIVAITNQLIEKTLLSKETFEWVLAYPLILTDHNDSIQAVASVNNVVNIQIYGDRE
jgi:hypothetical protein